VELLTQAGFPRGDLLLITDGMRDAELEPALAALTGGGYRLAVLGIGTPAGAPIPLPAGGFATDAAGGIVLSRLPTDTLGTLARRGGGIFQVSTPHGGDVEALTAWLASGTPGSDADATDRVTGRWREFGPWLLLPVMGCALLAFRRGALATLLAALALGPSPAARADWFRTPDQSGQQAFDEKRYVDAARDFANPAWKAAAEYRAGRYAQALMAQPDTDTAAATLYNQGNALARLGRYNEAIARYQQVLKTEPDHADARHNLELLQELLAPPPDLKNEQEKDEQRRNSEQQGADQSGTEDAAHGRQGERRSDEAGRDEQLDPPGEDEDPADSQQSREDGRRERSASDRQANGAADEAAGSDDAPTAANAREAAADRAEQQLATEQWLRQIPDDPGGLLRRKFRYQFERLKETGGETSAPW
jgi:Ca-activated chloride channel family protein